MYKYQKLCLLGIVSFGAISFCDVARAQYPYAPPPAIHYLRPEQIRPDLYGPNGSDPAPRYRSPRFRSSDSPSSSFNKAACEAALTRQLQAQQTDMNVAMSDPVAFGRRLQLIAESTPACRR
jgi:hypothetical protein